MKVLVTGLGMGFDFGVCDVCGIDLSWIINNPSILLWADKIVIPKEAFKLQLENEDRKIDKAVNLVLNMARAANIIELIDVKATYTQGVGKSIETQSVTDVQNILESFPEISKRTNEGVPGEFVLNGISYCGPYVSSINASLFLSQEIKAKCLFSDRDYNFLKYKYGIKNDKSVYQLRAFDEVFSCYLPNEMIIHNYAFEKEERCDECVKQFTCKETYLKDIETRMDDILRVRDRDELQIAKNEFQKVIDTTEYVNSSQFIEEIKREYEEKQRKINRVLKLVFPKVKRWTNVTASVSTAISAGNLLSGNMETAAIAGGISGLSKIVEYGMKYYESRNSWVGFIHKDLEKC